MPARLLIPCRAQSFPAIGPCLTLIKILPASAGQILTLDPHKPSLDLTSQVGRMERERNSLVHSANIGL